MNFLMCPCVYVYVCVYMHMWIGMSVCVCVPLLGSLSGEAQILLLPLEPWRMTATSPKVSFRSQNTILPRSCQPASRPPAPNSKGRTSKKSV